RVPFQDDLVVANDQQPRRFSRCQIPFHRIQLRARHPLRFRRLRGKWSDLLRSKRKCKKQNQPEGATESHDLSLLSSRYLTLSMPACAAEENSSAAHIACRKRIDAAEFQPQSRDSDNTAGVVYRRRHRLSS